MMEKGGRLEQRKPAYLTHTGIQGGCGEAEMWVSSSGLPFQTPWDLVSPAVKWD